MRKFKWSILMAVYLLLNSGCGGAAANTEGRLFKDPANIAKRDLEAALAAAKAGTECIEICEDIFVVCDTWAPIDRQLCSEAEDRCEMSCYSRFPDLWHN